MNKIDLHATICENLTALYARKNADYGDSFGKSFKEYGLTMACIRLEDKLNRIKALRNKDAQVRDESITDTLMDLANYSIMTLVEMRMVSDPMSETESPQTVEQEKPVTICAKCYHDDSCMNTDPSCQCNTCANDCPECCMNGEYFRQSCPITNCPDYVSEEG